MSDVSKYDGEIVAIAERTNVDADLLRAIMHYESGVGGPKDALVAPLDRDRTIQPMNVHRVWANILGVSVRDLREPAVNIWAGAQILKGIGANLPYHASVSDIYTLYNDLNADTVSWRGHAV